LNHLDKASILMDALFNPFFIVVDLLARGADNLTKDE
jgi:hypothetical protein